MSGCKMHAKLINVCILIKIGFYLFGKYKRKRCKDKNPNQLKNNYKKCFFMRINYKKCTKK